MIINKNPPEFVLKVISVRRGDARDVVVVQVLVRVAVVGEMGEFGRRVEGRGGRVAGFEVGVLVEAVAGSGQGALAELGGFDGDVAGAGLDGAFEVGVVGAFEAEVVGVGAGGGVG